MLFRLLGSRHREKGVLYKRGDVVESLNDLSVVFPKGRFERISELDVSVRPEIVTVQRSPSNETGVVSEQTTPALVSEEIDPGAMQVVDSEVVATDEHGEDVTKEFKRATKLGTKVFLKKDRYRVYDAVTGEELKDEKSPKKMKKKLEVIQFLNRFAKAQKQEE